MRLAEFFLDKKTSDDSLVKNPSSFTPKPGRNKELDTFLNNIRIQEPNTNEVQQRTCNTSKPELDALSNLEKDRTIVIKEADKGGGVVIMDTEFYRQIMLAHLNDQNTYIPINPSDTPKVLEKIKRLTTRYCNHLTEKETDFLTNFDSKESHIYGLPKIHKSKIISSAIQQQNSEIISTPSPPDLTIRPIIAGHSNPTSHLSHFIHLLLKDFLPLIPSFIKDTFDFLKYLPEKTTPNASLITLDIVSLYTNIPHQLGLKAVEFWIDKHPSIIPQRIPKTFILEAIHLILTNNYFEFEDSKYLQINGTAMGTKMAPVYANLTIGYLEDCLYKKLENKIPTQILQYVTQNWKRYLDDCFIIWKEDEDLLKDFLENLHNLHPKIKFTLERSKDKIPFLDVLVYIHNGTISTDIYRKPTDTMNYVDYTSCHPRHTRINIPFNLAKRITDIVSDPTIRETRFRELKETLLKKNYPKNLVERGIQEARKPNRNKKENIHKEIMPFVTTFNPNNPNLFPKTKTLLIHSSGPTMKEINSRFTLINSKKQPKNLKKILTRAKLQNETTHGVTKCNKPRCGTCPLILETKSVTFNKNPSEPFQIRGNLNCLSKNVVYVIICPGCGFQYIGQTSNLRNRVTLHKQHNRDPSLGLIHVNQHLRSCSPSSPTSFQICPIIYKEDEKERKFLETHMINKFHPELNSTS